MKKTLLFLTLLIMGLGVVVGCGQNQGEVSTTTTTITTTTLSGSINSFPHKDGYSWEYRYTITIGTLETVCATTTQYFDKTATLSNGLTVQRFVVTQEASAQMAGINTVVRTMGLSLSSGVNYCYVGETGVYTYGSEDSPTTEATLHLPLPLQVGKTWLYNPYLTCEAIAEEQIIVPGGTFNAIKVAVSSIDTSEVYCYEWYADSVGWIKTIVEDILIIRGSSYEVGTWVEELVDKSF